MHGNSRKFSNHCVKSLLKNIIMSMDDFKLGVFNGLSLMISFTHVENSLKIILLLASIVYTFQKIYEGYKKRISNEKNK